MPRADWSLGEYELTSITALREWNEDFDEDVDNRPTRPFNLDQKGTLDQEQFTQEIRLASPADGAFNYVVGAYFFEQEVRRTFQRTILTTTTMTDFTVDTTNYAFFGEVTYTFAEDWRAILGARYTDDDISYDFESFPDVDPTAIVFLEDETDEQDLSLKGAVEWDIGEESMAYFSYVQGYKGPGFSLTATTVELTPRIDPETSDAFELGLKSMLWDGRLMLDEFYVQGIGSTSEFLIPNGYLQQVPKTYERTSGMEVRYRW